MPRIRVAMPDELLQVAADRAERDGKSIDEVCAEAIDRYVETTANASPGAVRSRINVPHSSPQIGIELPEELFKRADKAAKRQGKRRHVLYADALAYHLKSAASADSAFDRAMDLPGEAWRPKEPS